MSTTSQLCQTDCISFDFEQAQGFRRKGKFCDLVIQSTANDNKKFINCHRVILASVSPFFKDKLGKGKISSLCIPDVQHETLEILIDYMYGSGGNIALNTDNVFKICTGAKHLQIDQLLRSCLKFIRSLVTVKDVIKVFKFSITENLLTLKKACVQYIVNNLEKVKTSGFLDLDCEQVKILVDLGTKNQTMMMADILLTVIEWLKTNTEERLEHACGLLSKIPLSKIDLKILRRLIIENDFLKSNTDIYSLYVGALEEISSQIQQAQIEKRKADELDTAEEIAVTDCERPPESGSSKRARFSTWNEYKPKKVTKSSNGDVQTGRVTNNVKTTLATNGRQNNALVYFCSKKEFQPGTGRSMMSLDLEASDLIKVLYYFNFSAFTAKGQIILYSLAYYKTNETEVLGSKIVVHREQNFQLLYHKHKIYCLGDVAKVKGVNRNPVAVWNIAKEQWEENAPDHVEKRTRFKSVVLGDYLYAVGGQTHFENSGDVERLKIQKPYEQWEKVSELPFGLWLLGICAANGCIYVIGDKTKLPSPNVALCYTPETNKWVEKKCMPTLKKGFAVAVVGKDIYTLGGSKSKSVHSKYDRVDIYDTELDCWKEGIPMNKKRHYFSAIVYNSCIYALGGDSDDQPTMEMFSMERQIWEDMGPLPNFGDYHHSVNFHAEEL